MYLFRMSTDLFGRVARQIDRWLRTKVHQYHLLQANHQTKLWSKGSVLKFFEAGCPVLIETFTPNKEFHEHITSSNGIILRLYVGNYEFQEDSVIDIIVDVDIYSNVLLSDIIINSVGGPDASVSLALEGGMDGINWHSTIVRELITQEYDTANFNIHAPIVNGKPVTEGFSQGKLCYFRKIIRYHQGSITRFFPQLKRMFDLLSNEPRAEPPRHRRDSRNKLPSNMTDVISLKNVDPKNAFYIKKNVYANHQIQRVFEKKSINELIRRGMKSPETGKSFGSQNVYKYVHNAEGLSLRPRPRSKKQNAATGRQVARLLASGNPQKWQQHVANFATRLAALRVKQAKKRSRNNTSDTSLTKKKQKKKV